MSPWDILGWLAVGAICLFGSAVALVFFVQGFAAIYTAASRASYNYRRRKKHRTAWKETRLTPPVEGQQWVSDSGYSIRVTAVCERGVLTRGGVPIARAIRHDDWQKFIDERRLALV